MVTGWRGLIKRVHPEGIPWPCSCLYDRLTRSEVFEEHYRMVAKDIVSLCPTGRLLDIGTGPARLLLKVHEESAGLDLVGVDVSEAMVKRGRENVDRSGLAGVIEVCEGSAVALPFEDATFDVVVSTGSMHHWKEQVTGLNETHRVLKPGGWGLMYDICARTPEAVRREAVRRFGRLRMTLLWLHSFEEPFLDEEEMLATARESVFKEGRTRWVGALCCLTLRKPT